MTRKSYDDDGNGGRIMQSSTRPPTPIFDIGRADHKMISRLLKKLLSRMGRIYDIQKASLAFYDHERHSLRVTHMFSKGILKSGLTLTIPGRRSLLYQVLMQGYPIVDNYPQLISKNVIEKKLLLASSTGSVVVIPLVCDNTRLGILSLASNNDSAFSPYLEGEGVEIVNDFACQTHEIVFSTAKPA